MRIQFLPADKFIEVPAGTLLHTAAARAGVTDLDLPCGGQGSCGQCLVYVIDGQGSEELVLACRTMVQADMVVRVPENRDTAMRVVGDSRFLAGDAVLPDSEALTPLFRFVPLTVAPASIDEHYSDWRRLLREVGPTAPGVSVHAGLRVLGALAQALRADEGRITVGLADRGDTWCVVDVVAGHEPSPAFGLAVDIGTTTVAVQLVALADGRAVETATAYNRQIRRGADVITRIDYARTPERLAELRQLVLETINALVGEVAEQACVDPRQIRAAMVAGNTTMIHLFLGLPPRYIREAPYVPTVNPVPALTGAETGLAIHPDATVMCAPGVGSYVGGDITAGLVSTDMAVDRDEVSLYLDIGTNGEIVVGNGDWLVGCACSAGPAFEGAGIKCGMRAVPGAIEHIELGDGGRRASYRVIGDRKPEGICGSGLICLLGELFRHGVIDAAGHFNPDADNPRLVAPTGPAGGSGSIRGYVVEWGHATATGDDLVIGGPDIENLIRTKAAIYAACRLILEKVGLDWSTVARVYIAGGFGRFIRLSEAITIGLLPDLPHGRFRYLGNAALTGAYLALLSAERRRLVDRTASRMTYIDLSSDPHYMDQYVKAMFLPHTDGSEFPSVTRATSAPSSRAIREP
jgi:uncharacterized 2Fe-2S/4Fe-4S cluster protein (DUF4445 family)